MSIPVARYVPAGDGLVKWVSGDEYTIKVCAADTGGSLSVVEAVVPPGGGPPLHTHRHEDEAFYLLSGELELTASDRTLTAGAGDFLFVPRGYRHRFRNVGTTDARMLFWYTPGGVERFFIEGGDDPVPGRRPEPWTTDRFAGLAELSEAVGMDVHLPREP